MDNCVPKLKNVRDSSRILQQYPFSEVWEIPGCNRDGDIMWSIIMAYLFHPPLNDSEISMRLKYLGELKVRDLKICVKNYNPFLHRNTDACDRLMEDLVLPFKDDIHEFYSRNPHLFPSTYENYICCQASSFLLKCNILVLIDEIHDKRGKVFPDTTPLLSFNKWLIIFDTVRNNTESFSFGLSKEIGMGKQMQALKEILKKTKITENNYSQNSVIYKICELPNIRENFIISLMKSKFTESIPYIYKSPYVIAKLRDALFETDPLVQDPDGKSALFHALIHEDTSLLYFLYDQTTKMCSHTGGSISCSTRAVPENLLKLKNSFIQIEENVNKLFSDNSEKMNTYVKRIKNLSRFNEYQIEICHILNNLALSQASSVAYCSSNIFEADERKKAILCILEIYEKYFDVADSMESHHFSEFCKYNDYITNIDFMTTVRFFDHLFLLKERLILPDSLYAKIENQFFLFIYCKDCFEELQKYENLSAQIVSRMILYQERLSLQKRARCFKKKLENQEICIDNVVKNIPEDIVQTLTNLPNIYGQFVVHRLTHYLNVATSVYVTDVKSILVLERTLLVIGECLKQTDVGFKTIKKVLPFILPSQLVSVFKRIRNSFSHLLPSHVSWRNSVEEEIQLFRNIQLELQILIKILMPILSAQKFKMERFILLTILKAVRKAVNRKTLSPHKESLREILPLYYPEFDDDDSLNFLENWKKHFQTVKKSLSAKMLLLNKDCSKLHRKNACWYNYSVMNIFDSVKPIISTLGSNDEEKIDDCLWALEYILEYISIDSKAKIYKREFLKKMKDRKTLFQEQGKFKNQKQKNNGIPQNNISKEITVFGSEEKDFSKLYNTKSFIQNGKPDTTITAQFPVQEIENTSQTRNKENESLYEDVSYKNECIGNKNCAEDFGANFEIFRKKVLDIISDYQEIYKKIIQDTNFKVTVQADTSFKHVGILKKALAGHSFLNNKEKKKIIDSVPSSFKDIHNAKLTLNTVLERQNTVANDTLIEIITKLPLNEEKKKVLYEDIIKDKKIAATFLKDIPDHFGELRDVMEKGEIANKKYENLCKKLEIPPEEKNILKKLVIGQKPKEPGNQLLFLRNRVKLLKEILIDSNKEIKQLSEKAKSSKTKSYLIERIVQLYLNEPDLQASVEMLLFDCMNLLKRKDLKDLWRKSSNLFNGIDLRNVLAHGNPLLESAGRILDPYDLPSELIRKMLQLVNDLSTIDCMVNIIEDSKADFKDFHQIMNDDESNKYDQLKKIILDCNNWKDYAFLIPVRKPVSDSCN